MSLLAEQSSKRGADPSCPAPTATTAPSCLKSICSARLKSCAHPQCSASKLARLSPDAGVASENSNKSSPSYNGMHPNKCIHMELGLASKKHTTLWLSGLGVRRRRFPCNRLTAATDAEVPNSQKNHPGMRVHLLRRPNALAELCSHGHIWCTPLASHQRQVRTEEPGLEQ